MKAFAVLLLLMLFVVVPSAAQQTVEDKVPAPSRVPEVGSKDIPVGQLRLTGTVHVGQSAPDFTVVSSSGRELTLSRLKGDWLVLVFAENREDFAALRDVHDQLAQSGLFVFGVCKEKPQRLRSYAESERLPFELLADPTGEVSSLYGMYDWERRATTRGFVVLDRRSVIRLALQGPAPPEEVASLAHYTVTGY